MDNKKSCYAVIPACVRYDSKIIPNAKLLYGEITALCNERGYCWATNDYFSRLYSVSKRTISAWIKSLCDAGYISLEFVSDNNNQKVKVRYLKVEANFNIHLMKTSIPSRKKVPDPHEANFAENNTINNTFNNLSDTFENANVHEIKLKAGKVFEADSDPYLLAKFLENNIVENSPKYPRSEQQRQRWAKDFDLMIRRDKIDADDIAEIIEWCQRDSF